MNDHAMTPNEITERIAEFEANGYTLPQLLRQMKWEHGTGDGNGSGRVTFRGVATTDIPEVAAGRIEELEEQLKTRSVHFTGEADPTQVAG